MFWEMAGSVAAVVGPMFALMVVMLTWLRNDMKSSLDKVNTSVSELSDRVSGLSDRVSRIEGHLGIYGGQPENVPVGDVSDDVPTQSSESGSAPPNPGVVEVPNG